MHAWLILEDGTKVRGEAIGARATRFGELVFNTSMTGYQEALTDPSYAGQVLLFTYPLIGNYGVHPKVGESRSIQAWGCVVRESCPDPWHPSSTMGLSAFLAHWGVPGIAGVDTRSLTVKVREHGTMRCCLTTEADPDLDGLLAQVQAMGPVERQHLVDQVTADEVVELGNEDGPTVVVVDCGCKESIVNALAEGARVARVPWDTSGDDVLGYDPDAVLVSNGPGDPAHPELMATTAPMVRQVAGEVPLYGICLGHQLISLAHGARTFKLKYGHRGSNQPILDRDTGKVMVTSQNHGFAVDPESLADTGLVANQVNCNDDTVEGVRNADGSVQAVQYHPEAHPGPLDAFPFFRKVLGAKGGDA